MVFLDHERLLRHIDEHPRFYLEGGERIHAQLSQSQPSNNAVSLPEQLLLSLQSRGMSTTCLDSEHSFVYGELDHGAAHTLLFYNHYATHSAAIWELLPIASRLLAFDAYQECIGTLPINVKWLLHISDQPNDLHLRSIVEKHRQQLQADGCLCETSLTAEEKILFPMADAMPLIFLGAKGLLCIELAAYSATSTIPSHYGSITANAAWRLLWALNSLKDNREEILIEGFYDSLTSIEDDILASLYTLPDTAPALASEWKMPELLLGLHGFQMHYAHLLTPTCTINSISGGEATNAPSAPSFPLQIPSHARAQVDFHLVPGQEPDAIFADLQRHLHNRGFSDIQTQQLYRCPPAYTPLSHSFVQHVRNATTQAYEHEPLILPFMAKTTPLTLLQQGSNMPILITSHEARQPSSQGWDDPAVAASLIQRMKQMALIIHALGNTQ